MADAVLVTKIKEGQRASQEWKQAWWDYCDANGLAQYDPAVHPTEVLRQFIDTHTHIHLSNPAPGPSPAGPVATAGHQLLVTKIKEGQRASEEWKQAWWSYCDANGLGKKDPAAHSTEVLQQFINTHSHIHLDLSSPAPLKPVPVLPPAVGGVLVAKIKEGQRASQEWKQAWWDYCDANGLAQYDPAVHPTEVLRQFIDTHTHIHLSNPAPGPSPAVAPAAPAATAEHQSLVAKIKEGQSASEEWKQAWWSYCDASDLGRRDPAVHPTAALQHFINTHSHIHLSNPAPGPSPAVVPAAAASTAGHQLLVTKIKEGQRASEEWKQAWWSYCDANGLGKKDPAAHPTEVLRHFINTHSHIHPSNAAPFKPVPGPSPAVVPGAPVATAEHQSLVTQVKQVQQTSPQGREAWANWCTQWGEATRDPSRHNASFLKQFLATNGPMTSAMGGLGVQPQTRTIQMPQTTAIGPVKESLVTQIKEFQRSSPEMAQVWQDHCAQYGQGSKDPMRHDVAFLHEFMTLHGPASLKRPREPDAYAAQSPQETLIKQIKEGQRMSEDWKAAWWAWCDTYGEGKRDPSRHSVAFLREFLSTHDAPSDGRAQKRQRTG